MPSSLLVIALCALIGRTAVDPETPFPVPAAHRGAAIASSPPAGGCLAAYGAAAYQRRNGAGDPAVLIDRQSSSHASVYPWHGDGTYWRWGVPTALIVPPTAPFHSTYDWGGSPAVNPPVDHFFGR